MYNVIFYEKVKEVTEIDDIIIRQYTDDEGNYTDTASTREVVKRYRVPTKFVFETATNCDKLLSGYSILDDFVAEMPSLNSAEGMFSLSSITSFSGENGTCADFNSLTNADDMFKDCKKLTSIKINTSSLVNVSGFVDGCKLLETYVGDFSSLIDGTSLFNGLNKLNHFEASLMSLRNGTEMFANTALETFSEILPVLATGNEMFYHSQLKLINLEAPELLYADSMFENCYYLNDIVINCPLIKSADQMFKKTALTEIELNAPKMVSGRRMFDNVANFTTFRGDLGNLINGESMFEGTIIDSFQVNSLDNLECADKMFIGSQITEWDLDMPSLKSAISMFGSKDDVNCALISFTSDLSCLVDGTDMFGGCVGLEHFDAALPSLKYGESMFVNCKLDSKSVMNIVETLPNVSSEETRVITIGVNCTEDEIDDFISKEGIYKNLAELIMRKLDSGWDVTLSYNK